MKTTVRKADIGDMPAVLKLIKELADYEKALNEVEIDLENLEHNGFGKNPLFTCFVAETDEEIVGMALIYFRYSTWKGKTVHLEDLMVKKEYRGKGVGLELYKEVMRFGQENKVKRVEWIVIDWNTNAIEFYKKTGATVLSKWKTVQFDEQAMNKFLSEV
jgi:ribosomal protein S18 acetylase RimI-like enzyme